MGRYLLLISNLNLLVASSYPGATEQSAPGERHGGAGARADFGIPSRGGRREHDPQELQSEMHKPISSARLLKDKQTNSPCCLAGREITITTTVPSSPGHRPAPRYARHWANTEVLSHQEGRCHRSIDL